MRDQVESAEALRKAEKRLSQAINRAKKQLKERGIQARKDEKARLQRLKECTQKNELPRPEDLFPVREPDKQPTQIEALMCTAEYYPELVQALKEIKAQDAKAQDAQRRGLQVRGLARERECPGLSRFKPATTQFSRLL